MTLNDESFDAAKPIYAIGEEIGAGNEIPRRVPAWPVGHEPSNACERALWESFEDLRVDPASKLTQEIVALRIGRSRTSISTGKDGYELLREAIKDEIRRRRTPPDGKTSAKARPKKSKEQREAEKEARRETSIRYYQDIAQRGDAAIVELKIRTIRAESERDRLKVSLQTIFADFKAGLWKRADGSDGDLGDIEAFLSIPGYGGQVPDAGVSPSPVAASALGSSLTRPAWKDGRSSWRTHAR